MNTSIVYAFSSAALLASSSLAAQQLQAPPSPVALDAIVMIVGDQPITRYELQEAVLARIQRHEAEEPKDSIEAARLDSMVLDDLVQDELIIQKAKDLKITIADGDISPQVDQQVRQVRANFRNDAEFRSELQKAGLGSPEDYRKFLMEQFRRQLTRDRVIQKLTQDGRIVPVSVSDAEITAEFEKAKAYLPKKPATVTFKQIVIMPRPSAAAKEVARVRAESILARLKSGADFELTAKRESMDPMTKENGGDLGWMRRGVRPDLDPWLFGSPIRSPLPPGQLSPVFESAYGFAILRVERVQPGEARSRQILIVPTIDSADVGRTAVLADSVGQSLRSGVPFDTLAKKYNDYMGGEETAILTPYNRDSLPDTYQKAFADQKPGAIVVFRIAGSAQRPEVPKYVVAQLLSVDEAGERTLDEMRDAVRSELAQRGGVRRYIDALKKQTFVSGRLDLSSVASTSTSKKP